MKNQIGMRGEALAVEFLKKKQYEIIEQNWRCRLGEIDIVARDDIELVFCEVKTRRAESTQVALVNITESKREKMIRAAQYYLDEYDLDEAIWRIDAIGIAIPRNGEAIIDHVEDVLDW